MAYFNQYNPYPQYNQMPQNQPNFSSQRENSIIWVQGVEAAKSYLVAPNSTVQLWDSEAQVIYLKSADASGMPSIKILDYTIRDTQAPQSQAITEGSLASDVKALKERVELLSRRMKELTKAGEDDE